MASFCLKVSQICFNIKTKKKLAYTLYCVAFLLFQTPTTNPTTITSEKTECF